MNRRSFLGLFGKMVALAAVPTALLRSAPAAAAVPLPEDFVFWTPYWPYWLENNPGPLADQVHDVGRERLLARRARLGLLQRLPSEPAHQLMRAGTGLGA
jgi:hypothetical protein